MKLKFYTLRVRLIQLYGFESLIHIVSDMRPCTFQQFKVPVMLLFESLSQKFQNIMIISQILGTALFSLNHSGDVFRLEMN